MPVAVAAYLMPQFCRLANESRKLLSHPTQEKEGASDIVRSKQFKQYVGVAFNAGGQSAPLVLGYRGTHCFRVEIIFDVYSYAIQDIGSVSLANWL
jgi:hypothetical protein